MIDLPEVPALIRRTQALAAVDLILPPDWEYRYYSFNAHWSPGQMMASLRNGCGAEWWLLFHSEGWAALKGLEPESKAWQVGGEKLTAALRAAIPADFHDFSKEPAFRWDETGFVYLRAVDGDWVRVNDLTTFAQLEADDENLLVHLVEPASSFVEHAEAYYEMEVPLEVVEAIYRHEPITKEMVAALNEEADWKEIQQELFDEIGYPRF